MVGPFSFFFRRLYSCRVGCIGEDKMVWAPSRRVVFEVELPYNVLCTHEWASLEAYLENKASPWLLYSLGWQH